MKLVVFPGAADPFSAYRDVYDLLKEQAEMRGIEFVLENYPGHDSFDDRSYLSVKETVKTINASIIKLEEDKEPYIVLCRSFGCHCFIEILRSNELNPTFLTKLILWGLHPYYILYRELVKDFSELERRAKEKGVRIGRELFNEVYPPELAISEISKELPFNIYITSGDKDELYPEHFRRLLRDINENPRILFPERICGLGHSVAEYNEEYIDLIFK
jgi:hypothetical protein